MAAQYPGALPSFTSMVGATTDPLSAPSHVTLEQKQADEIAAIAKAPPATPQPFITGRFYVVDNSNASTSILGEGDLELVWWPLPLNTVIAEIWEEVTIVGTAGAVRRVGIYDHSPTTGLPVGAALYDSGTVSAESTGTKQNIISGGLTVATAYGIWIGGVTQGAAGTRPQMRSLSVGQRGMHASTASGITSVLAVGYRHASVSGALPTFSTTPTISGGLARQAVKIG